MPSLSFKDYYGIDPEPEQIEKIYSSGFQGTLRDPISDAYLSSMPDLYQEFPKVQNEGKGKLSLPYRACLALEPEFGRYERQTTGDCVSHSTRNAGMLDYCIDAVFGETDYQGRLATENIYGSRGHGGQGASCSRLANYVSLNGAGGFLIRKDYGFVDLSTYKSSIGHNWGRRGTPTKVNEEGSKNKALQVLKCRSIAQAKDALAAGFGISRCGSRGYSSKRNEDGVSKRKGSWAHAMAIIGYDDTEFAHNKYNGALFLVQNSWGKWNSGGKRHEQPDGSFWLEQSTFQSEINSGGIYIIASVRGYNRELVYDTMSNVASLAS